MPNYKVPGPCSVTFGGKALGKTKTGILLRIRTPWAPMVTEENSEEPSDYRFAGKSGQIEAQFVDMAKIHVSGLMTLLTNAAQGTPGDLASDKQQTLSILDRHAQSWICKAVFAAPNDLQLSVNSEIIIPIIWNIVPVIGDPSNTVILFSTIPNYV